MNEQPQSMQFSEDGNFCVIGFTEGKICAFKVDTLNEITSVDSTSAQSLMIDQLSLPSQPIQKPLVTGQRLQDLDTKLSE